MKRRLLKTWLLLCALIVGSGTMWADEVTLTAGTNGTACYVNNQSGIKVGTSSKGGDMTITVPANTTKLILHAAAWKGVTGLSLNISGPKTKTTPESIALTADDGISNNSPFTLSGNESNFVFEIALSNITTETNVIFTSSIAKRFVVWGASAQISGGGGSTTYSVIYDANGATSGDVPVDDSEYENDDEVTVLGNTGNLAKTGCAFGGWNTQADGEGVNYVEDNTFTITANTTLYAKWNPYTVTAKSNNEIYGTVSLNGSVITATPAAGYTYASPAYTVNPANSATVAQDGNTFTVTPTANTEVTINFEILPTYTVTFSDGGSVTQESYGATVMLPSRSAIDSYAFAGWSTTNVASETTDAPTIISAGGYTPTANITLYPVYSKTEGNGGTQNKTASVTISDYAAANGWSNATQYGNIAIDDNVTATATGGGNTGKYYTSSGGTWRIYKSENAYLTISVPNGELTSATITFSNSTLSYNNANITSGKAVSLSGDNASFWAGGTTYITAISVNYTISGGGTTYYWSAPVAATVERPEIVVAQNPFLFSTTATITCATDDVAIKYSFDGETWNDYSEALTITATTTIYAKAVKNEEESSIASVTATKNLATPTVTISGDLTVDLDGETNVEAGTLTATVTYNDAAVEGAAVTWSSNNEAVATIGAETGVVTIKTRGTVTFTATFAANSDYALATDTKTITVIDSKVPGSQANPYTISQITATETGVYVQGIISSITEVSTQYKNATYMISEDGTTTKEFTVFRGRYLDNADFISEDQISVGDAVVIYGNITTYNEQLQLAQGNYLVSLKRKVATPTFDPAAGAVKAGSTVAISTTTEDATIYYTVDGSEPTTESTVYTEPITIDAEQTIKAIAVKDGMINSDVAIATYTIDVTPAPKYTVTFADDDSSVAQEIADEEVTLPTRSDIGSYTFAGWSETNVESETTTAPTIIEAGDYTPTDDITLYPVYSRIEIGGGETLAETMSYSSTNWNLSSENTFDKKSYTLFGDGGYVESTSTFDLSTLSKVIVTARTYGGADYEYFNVGTATAIWKEGDATSGKTMTEYTLKDGASLIGTDKIRVTSTSGDGSDNGVGISKVEIYIISDINYYTSMPIALTAKMGDEGEYWATYYNEDYNFKAPEGTKVFKVNLAGTGIVMTEITDGIVTKGQGVVLKANSANITMTVNASASADNYSDNSLVGTMTTIDNPGNAYVLNYKPETGAGFYKLKADKTIGANKAYLTYDGLEAREFFGFSMTTGINSLTSAPSRKSEGSIYSLDGRRISQPTKKGMYIQNGKKVIIRSAMQGDACQSKK